jgi:hypothetical protein
MSVTPLLRETHPELKRDWHPHRNVSIDFDSLRANSSTKVWWRCTKNPKHEWEADIRRRAINGNGCPFCSGLRVLREDSFAALYPSLLAEWHLTRNGKLDPWQLAPKSNRRVWWQCNTSHKHEWRTQLHSRTTYGSGCRQCNNIRNPLSEVAPEIAKEWHPILNGNMTADAVSASSEKRVWWRCLRNSRHEWQATVAGRARAKTLCPHCAKLFPVKSLPTLNIYDPALAAQWHPEKNNGGLAADFLPNSSHKAWWICPRSREHVWSATIRNRARFGQGCPYCAFRTKHVLPGKSLADRFPELAKEWHPTQNADLKPSDVLPGSSKRVWWQCGVNPAHEWDATITTRTHPRSKGRCPFCSGARVTPETSLLTCHPDIARQWDPVRNLPLTPSTIKRASARSVWWVCSVDPSHAWQARVKNRTLHHTGCPICDSEERVRRLQQLLVESAGGNVDYLKTFSANLQALRALANRSIPEYRNLRQTFHRMLYASAITAMETYLSDAFFQNVIENDALVERLLQSAPELKDRKYSLTELFDWNKRLKQRASEYLFDIVWHNLAKVRQLYKSVLNVTFPTNCAEVHRAVAIRHDLVHRNGKTKSGVVHRFKESEITAVFVAVESFVNEIDCQLKARREAQTCA